MSQDKEEVKDIIEELLDISNNRIEVWQDWTDFAFGFGICKLSYHRFRYNIWIQVGFWELWFNFVEDNPNPQT